MAEQLVEGLSVVEVVTVTATDVPLVPTEAAANDADTPEAAVGTSRDGGAGSRSGSTKGAAAKKPEDAAKKPEDAAKKPGDAAKAQAPAKTRGARSEAAPPKKARGTGTRTGTGTGAAPPPATQDGRSPPRKRS
jgi:hypothetical protein